MQHYIMYIDVIMLSIGIMNLETVHTLCDTKATNLSFTCFNHAVTETSPRLFGRSSCDELKPFLQQASPSAIEMHKK